MGKKLIVLFLLAISVVCEAQVTSIRYFSDQYLRKEVSLEKAKFAKVITNDPTGTQTTEIKNLRKDVIIRSQTFKDAEPVGTWIYMSGTGPKSLDYNFPLKYSDDKCNENEQPKLKDYFADNDSVGYKAPVISTGEKNFNYFIGKNIIYPGDAVRNNIQGVVNLVFTVTSEGSVENVYVQKGKHMLLDKEAVRVVRKLKFSAPPAFNGQATSICVSMPVTFRIL